MVTNRNDIGTKFETGDVPSQADFKEIFDSFVHKDEDKATAAMIDAGTDDEHYVTPALLRLGLQNIGAISGGGNLPIKENRDNFTGAFIELEKLPIESSVKVFKNGQLLQEDDDYTINYETAVLTFSAAVENRNIEIDYWYKSSDPIPGNGTNYVDLITNQTIYGNKGFADVTDFLGIRIDNGGSNRGLHVINNGDVEGVFIRSTDSGDSLVINDSTTATGTPLQIQKDGITKFTVDGNGQAMATSFVKSGSTSDDVLLGDGSTTSLSALGSGNQDLQSVLNVGSYMEFDDANSSGELFAGTLNNRSSYIDHSDGTTSSGWDLTNSRFNAQNFIYGNSTGRVRLEDGNVKLVRENISISPLKKTTIDVSLPTNNTNISFPAKEIDGNYTLATTSDFKTINGESIIGTGDIIVSGGSTLDLASVIAAGNTTPNGFTQGTIGGPVYMTTVGNFEYKALDTGAQKSSRLVVLPSGTNFESNDINYGESGIGAEQGNAIIWAQADIKMSTVGFPNAIIYTDNLTSDRIIRFPNNDGTLVTSASPTFTGIPTAPTAPAGDNSTKIATTAFVLENTKKVELQYALSDETTDLTIGTLLKFRMPFAMTLTSVRISTNTAPTGSAIIVDVKESGTSIFSTLLSIDISEKTSVTAATPAVISDTNLADDAEIEISTTQVGSTVKGNGLKITFIGSRA